jgi:hypothetical protein
MKRSILIPLVAVSLLGLSLGFLGSLNAEAG